MLSGSRALRKCLVTLLVFVACAPAAQAVIMVTIQLRSSITDNHYILWTKVDKLFPGEFVITSSDGDAYSFSGLSYPTKFNLASTFELPFNEDWFEVPPGAPHGQVPKLGVLHPSLMRRARAAMEAAKKVRY